MRTVSAEDLSISDTIHDAYSTCKYIERQGISLEEFNLGNVHDEIEDAVDDNALPIIQVIWSNQVQGYLIH